MVKLNKRSNSAALLCKAYSKAVCRVCARSLCARELSICFAFGATEYTVAWCVYRNKHRARETRDAVRTCTSRARAVCVTLSRLCVCFRPSQAGAHSLSRAHVTLAPDKVHHAEARYRVRSPRTTPRRHPSVGASRPPLARGCGIPTFSSSE